MNKKLPIIITLIFMFFVSAISGTQYDENTIKAVYIGRFAQFVDIQNDSSDKLIIGVFEKKGITPRLIEIYKSMKINGNTVKIKYYTKIDSAILQSNILFIPKLNGSKLIQILKIVNKSAILTVSDTPGYSEKGVHINLYRSGKNIKFEINQRAVNKSNLHISYQLYELARIIQPLRGAK